MIGCVHQCDLSWYNSQDVRLSGPKRPWICRRILEVLRFWPRQFPMIDLRWKVELEARFGSDGPKFWPVVPNDRALLAKVAADITTAAITDDSWRGRHRALFLGGGPTVEDCIRRIEPDRLRHAEGVLVVPSNRAEWPDERLGRGAVPMARAFSANTRARVVDPRTDPEALNTPGVVLISAGNRTGFPCQLLRRRGIDVPDRVVGDVNGILLTAYGADVRGGRIEQVLRPIRYVHALDAWRQCCVNKTVIMALTDTPYPAALDGPPTGSSKAEIARVCLNAGLVHRVVLPAALAERLLEPAGVAV
jgi:hypothetical protein